MSIDLQKPERPAPGAVIFARFATQLRFLKLSDDPESAYNTQESAAVDFSGSMG